MEIPLLIFLAPVWQIGSLKGFVYVRNLDQFNQRRKFHLVQLDYGVPCLDFLCLSPLSTPDYFN